MQGIGSVVAAIFLFGVAGAGFRVGVSNEYLLAVAGLGALLFVRGVIGLVTGQVPDLGYAFRFIRNPAGAIVDGAEEKAVEPFDPDAAIARYLQNRPGGSPALDAPNNLQPAPPRGFGRKGL